jgi:hypothetical protein
MCVQMLLRSLDVYPSFPCNGRLCWVHSASFEQIFHSKVDRRRENGRWMELV